MGRRRNATAKKTFSYPICSLLIEGRRYRMFLPSACRIAEANAVDSHSQSSFNSLLKLMLESKNDQKINSYTWSLTTITCHFLVVFIVCVFFVLLFSIFSLASVSSAFWMYVHCTHTTSMRAGSTGRSSLPAVQQPQLRPQYTSFSFTLFGIVENRALVE